MHWLIIIPGPLQLQPEVAEALLHCIPAYRCTTVPLVNDGQGIELGMRFRSTQDGFITGIRYYKGAGATGTHIGSLWNNTGTTSWHRLLSPTKLLQDGNRFYLATRLLLLQELLMWYPILAHQVIMQLANHISRRILLMVR